MKKASVTAIALFCLCIIITAQELKMDIDTIAISDVNIKGRHVSGESGYKLTTISSEIINNSAALPLSNLLERNSLLGIKSYGPGGLATASFRGVGANQTKVVWEGVPINSPGTSQVDLSLIPAARFQEVNIYHGASSVVNGTGGPGGTISLRTIPQWGRGAEIVLNQGFGSFGQISDNITLTAGSDNFQIISRLIYRKSDNDFPYLDYINYSPAEVIKRKHNKLNIKGIAQGIFIKSGKSIISTNMWYNYANRDLPGPIVTTNSSEKQIDKQIRFAAGLKRYSGNTLLDLKIGMADEYLYYSNIVADIESETMSRLAYVSASGKYFLNDFSAIKISFSNMLNSINSANHNGYHLINKAIIKTEYSISFNESFSILLFVEATHANRKFYKPVASMGADLRLTKSGLLYLKGNIGSSITIPTLNDLYWNPGGNPDLLSESGVNREISLELRETGEKRIETSGELTIYSSRLSNLIKWLPGDYGIWSPINIADINSYGSELSFSGRYKSGNSELRITLNYSFTRIVNGKSEGAENNSTGKQLIYVPFNQANGEIRYKRGKITLAWFTDFTGIRYTTTDNSTMLPAAVSSDFDIAYIIKLGRHSLLSSARIGNIFNNDFEYIAFYPAPRRNFLLTITYKFNKP